MIQSKTPWKLYPSLVRCGIKFEKTGGGVLYDEVFPTFDRVDLVVNTHYDARQCGVDKVSIDGAKVS